MNLRVSYIKMSSPQKKHREFMRERMKMKEKKGSSDKRYGTSTLRPHQAEEPARN